MEKRQNLFGLKLVGLKHAAVRHKSPVLLLQRAAVFLRLLHRTSVHAHSPFLPWTSLRTAHDGKTSSGASTIKKVDIRATSLCTLGEGLARTFCRARGRLAASGDNSRGSGSLLSAFRKFGPASDK